MNFTIENEFKYTLSKIKSDFNALQYRYNTKEIDKLYYINELENIRTEISGISLDIISPYNECIGAIKLIKEIDNIIFKLRHKTY